MQRLTYRKEDVRHVHGNKDRDTDVGERDEVAPSDEPQSDTVLVVSCDIACSTHMSDELLVVLAGLLNLEREDDRLLAPVGSLHEVVDLETPRHLTVRVVDEEVLGLVPPGREVAHSNLRSATPAWLHSRFRQHP